MDDSHNPIPREYRAAIVAGVVLGVVAACVVWYLERFETKRVVAEAERILSRHAAFEEWLRERRGSSSSSPEA